MAENAFGGSKIGLVPQSLAGQEDLAGLIGSSSLLAEKFNELLNGLALRPATIHDLTAFLEARQKAGGLATHKYDYSFDQANADHIFRPEKYYALRPLLNRSLLIENKEQVYRIAKRHDVLADAKRGISIPLRKVVAERLEHEIPAQIVAGLDELEKSIPAHYVAPKMREILSSLFAGAGKRSEAEKIVSLLHSSLKIEIPEDVTMLLLATQTNQKTYAIGKQLCLEQLVLDEMSDLHALRRKLTDRLLPEFYVAQSNGHVPELYGSNSVTIIVPQEYEVTADGHNTLLPMADPLKGWFAPVYNDMGRLFDTMGPPGDDRNENAGQNRRQVGERPHLD